MLEQYNVYNHDRSAAFPNFLYNTRDESSDLITPYIVCKIFERAKKEEYVKFTKNEIKDSLEICFQKSTIDNCIDEIINYMLNSKMLRAERANENYLIAQPKIFEGWKLMKIHSSIIEIIRDSCFIETDKPYQPSSSVRQEESFINVLEFIDGLASAEQKVLTQVDRRGNRDLFRINFGSYQICNHLLAPVQESIYRFYNSPSDDGAKLPSNVSKHLSELKGFLRGIYKY